MRYRMIVLAAMAAALAACEGAGVGSAGVESQSAAAPVALGARGEVETDPLPIGSDEEFLQTIGDRVHFSVDRYDLSAQARAILERQAQWLQRYPGRRVVIQGHADERGTREYNLALGDRRANAVKSFLVAMGVEPSRITTVSFGKEQPVALGPTETAWAQNRRGVTIVD